MIVTVDTALGLAGKVAIVTEGTYGVGLAMAAKLCDSGARVVTTYSGSDPELGRAETVLRDRAGSFMFVRMSPQEDGGVDELLGRCLDRHGRVDHLVHVALPWQMRPVGAARVAAAGALPVLSERLARHMRDGGRIVAALCRPGGDDARSDIGFDVRSAAVITVVRDLAARLAPAGVTVNTLLAPELCTEPDVMNRGLADLPAGPAPAGRLTAPQEVANAAALLCTAEAAWITGQVITVDGGAGMAPGRAAPGRR